MPVHILESVTWQFAPGWRENMRLNLNINLERIRSISIAQGGFLYCGYVHVSVAVRLYLTFVRILHQTSRENPKIN